jgi:Ca2+/H+ antiporter, TMEM165/GDT1 family
MRRHSRQRRIVFFLLIAPIAFFLFGWITMLLWNNVLAEIIKVGTITFWQAWGLLVLSRLLFGGFGGGKGSNYYSKKRMKERWENMKQQQANAGEAYTQPSA